MGGVPLQPALPWRPPGRGLLHRASSTVPQPIYPEASEKRHRLRNQTLLFTLQLREYLKETFSDTQTLKHQQLL
jgi:hypothetical protein